MAKYLDLEVNETIESSAILGEKEDDEKQEETEG